MTASNRTAPAKVNSRRAARMHAREQQRQRETRKKYTQMVIWSVVAIAVIAAVSFIVVKSVQAQPGKPVPNQGQTHIDKGAAHVAYNSKPPTSGPHWNIAGEAPVDWGIYDTQIPDEAQVHNLEHGGIMIQYDCDCPDLVAQLKDFYNRYVPTHKLPLFPNSSKIVIAPYKGLPAKITLTAWTRIDTMDDYDEARITRFIEAWRDKGPEAAP
ncbi:MAG TPA: DUF3105 domain-containing protein [Chloroflexota bacterium]|nr:DUF3105 domain-containing protein [Chloroflexota bacterium]